MFFVGLDEIDLLVMQQEGGASGGGEAKGHKLDLFKALLQLVGPVPNILFIGCTNFKDKLDETFTRANRMSEYILVPSCSAEERDSFFEYNFPVLNTYLLNSPYTKTLLMGATKTFTIAQLLQMEREFSNLFQDKYAYSNSILFHHLKYEDLHDRPARLIGLVFLILHKQQILSNSINPLHTHNNYSTISSFMHHECCVEM